MAQKLEATANPHENISPAGHKTVTPQAKLPPISEIISWIVSHGNWQKEGIGDGYHYYYSTDVSNRENPCEVVISFKQKGTSDAGGPLDLEENFTLSLGTLDPNAVKYGSPENSDPWGGDLYTPGVLITFATVDEAVSIVTHHTISWDNKAPRVGDKSVASAFMMVAQSTGGRMIHAFSDAIRQCNGNRPKELY